MAEETAPAAELVEAADSGALDRVLALVGERDEEARAEFRRAALRALRERLQQAMAALDPAGETGSGGVLHTDPGDHAPKEGTEEPFTPEMIRHWRAEVKRNQRRVRALQLAIAGVGAQKEVESALFGTRGGSWLEDDPEFWTHAFNVLATRRTEWRVRVLLRGLEYTTGRWDDPRALRARLERGLALVREGVLPEDVAISYLAQLARRAAHFDCRSPLGRRVVWAALVARDHPFIGNVLHDPDQLIKRLGIGERGPLITLAVQSLAEQSRGTQANWWAQLVTRLKVTEAEWVQNREAALDLVNAPTARAASIGLVAAKALLKAGAATPEELVPLLAGVVHSETLGVARNAVGLLRTAAARDPDVREAALLAAMEGLAHPKAAVPEAVLAWLEEDAEAWRQEPAVLLALADALETAAGPAAVRLSRLLATVDPDGGAENLVSRDAPAGEAVSSLRTTLEAAVRAEAVPERRQWLEVCLAALDGGAPVPEPREDREVLWRRGALLEFPHSPEETARLLLTMAALRESDPPATARLIAAVSTPAPEAEKPTLRRMLQAVWADPYFGGLARIWLGEPAGEYQNYLENLGVRRDGTPLSTPTHQSGWLAPDTFVRRVLERGRLTEADLPEVVAALYRLPIDRKARSAAWDRLAPALDRCDPFVASALRMALGPATPTRQDWEEHAESAGKSWRRLRLTTAARRSRHPEESGRWLADHLGQLPSGSERMQLPDSAAAISVGYPLGHGSFAWPAGAQAACDQLLERDASNLWSDTLVDLLCTAARPDIRLRHLLPAILVAAAHENARVRAAAVDLVALGIADGRLYGQDLLRELSPCLARQEARPRMLLAVLKRLTEQDETQREIVVCCLEHGLAAGLDAITGGDRAALLEALLEWRASAGRSVEDPEARARLETLAAERKKSRTVELARQLLQLTPVPGTNRIPSRQCCAAHDVRQAFRRSPGWEGLLNAAG